MKFEMNLKIEKPRYFTVSDITYAQVDAWFGHTTRDLKLDLIYPKLKNKKYRDLTNTYLVEGEHLVEEAYKNNLLIKIILLEDTICNYDIEKIYVTKEVMKKLTELDTPNKIIGIVKKNTPLPIGNKILILDNIQDPGNLGTILRTAEGAGIDGIIMNKGTVDIYNPKVVRSTMGSIFRVPFMYCDDIMGKVDELKKSGVKVYAAALGGTRNYSEPDYTRPSAFAIGNEGNGLTDEMINAADERIKIPMLGKVESLNVANAAGILMYEAFRQKGF